MKSTREKFLEIENVISHSTMREGHEAWCNVMSALWNAFSKDERIIERLHPFILQCDGLTSESVINTINEVSKEEKDNSRFISVKIDAAPIIDEIKSKTDEINHFTELMNKDHIIAFNDLNDVPLVLIHGEKVMDKTKVFVDWTTDNCKEIGRRCFDINWYNEGVIQKGVRRD